MKYQLKLHRIEALPRDRYGRRYGRYTATLCVDGAKWDHWLPITIADGDEMEVARCRSTWFA